MQKTSGPGHGSLRGVMGEKVGGEVVHRPGDRAAGVREETCTAGLRPCAAGRTKAPVTRSVSTQPRAHMSAGGPGRPPARTSGARKAPRQRVGAGFTLFAEEMMRMQLFALMSV